MIKHIVTRTGYLLEVGENYKGNIITNIMPSYDDKGVMWFEIFTGEEVLCSVPCSSVEIVAYFLPVEEDNDNNN